MWNLELAEFWRTLPSSLRFERQFCKANVRKMEINITNGSPIPEADMYKPNPLILKMRKLNPLILKALDKLKLRNTARRIHAMYDYSRHDYAWYGIMRRSEYVRVFHGQENINTYLANQTLKTIFPDWKIPLGLDFLANPAT